MSGSSSSSTPQYIYHERQDAALCGQHALNNLVQGCHFTAERLARIGLELDQLELAYMSSSNKKGKMSKEYLERLQEGSGNVDEAGNFSIQVLRAALQERYKTSLLSISDSSLDPNRDITTYPGFICNRQDHWFAIRKIGTLFFNLNSMLKKPKPISHFRLAAELESLQQEGYSVFIVPTKALPEADRSTGQKEYWWNYQDIVGGAKRKMDWSELGTGQRLDGKVTNSSSTAPHNMTEEEQLQMAMAASLSTAAAASTTTNYGSPSPTLEIPPEPEASNPKAVLVQFRFPNGKRQKRRFLESESVKMVYRYCHVQVGHRVTLKCGYPPQSLEAQMHQTVGEAQLKGQAIQVASAV